jgi:hypothetical protein
MGNIDCTKDTREVFKKTIGRELNESLGRITGKFLVVHIVNNFAPSRFLMSYQGTKMSSFFLFLHGL